MRLTKYVLFALAALLLALPVAAQDETVVYATAQRFEHGLMIWRADTGQIWALADSGSAYSFPATVYSPLPDNPIFGNPPSRLRPIFGFGKVWGNYGSVRSALGWPTLQEIGFNMPVRRAGGTTYLTQLDQTVIQINANATWTRTSGPTSPLPAILSFNALPDTVIPGERVTLSWNVQGTEYALIEVWRNDRISPVVILDYLPTSGTTTIRFPEDVSDSVRVVLWGVNRSRHPVLVTLWERVVQSELRIDAWQSPVTEIQTQAAFQQYQYGFMIWRADTGAVMAFGNAPNGQVLTFAESMYAGWADLPDDFDLPPDTVRPINAFGKVWRHTQVLRGLLGFATGQEQGYQATIGVANGAPTSVSLPDGRTVTISGDRFWSS